MLSCCCPPSLKRRSVRLDEDVAIPIPPAHDAPNGSDTSRRVTTHARRRAAVTSEKSEMLASCRWHSAFEALRRSEPKNPERVAVIVGVLRNHDLFAEWDEDTLCKIAQAMRETLARQGDAIITQGESGDNFYLVVEGECAAYVGESSAVSQVRGACAWRRVCAWHS
jgi:hypothetical protein